MKEQFFIFGKHISLAGFIDDRVLRFSLYATRACLRCSPIRWLGKFIHPFICLSIHFHSFIYTYSAFVAMHMADMVIFH